MNCCELFSVQFSPYGICYSFNSHVTLGNPHINVRSLLQIPAPNKKSTYESNPSRDPPNHFHGEQNHSVIIKV